MDEEKVKKDMASEYTEALSKIIGQIDEVKMRVGRFPPGITCLHERVHALFIKLAGKMTDPEIKTQYEVNERLEELAQRLWFERKNEKHFLEGQPDFKTLLDLNVAKKIKRLVEQREIHLNRVMERLGLTAQQTEKKRVN